MNQPNMSEEFQAAVDKANNMTTKPSNEIMLKLYGLFKQATVGDVEGNRPTGFDFKAIAKYDSWADNKGKTSDAAAQEYIDMVNSIN